MRRRIQSLYHSWRENKLDFNFNIEFYRTDSVFFIVNTVVYRPSAQPPFFFRVINVSRADTRIQYQSWDSATLCIRAKWVAFGGDVFCGCGAA